MCGCEGASLGTFKQTNTVDEMAGNHGPIRARHDVRRGLFSLFSCRYHGLRMLQFGPLCLMMAGLSSCAVVPLPAGRSGEPQLSALQQFYAQAPRGGRIFVKDSPWGGRVTVVAHESYYAASGRTCRKLTIRQGGMRRPGLVCRLPDAGWEKVRALARDRRPVSSLHPAPLQRGEGQ